MKSFLWISKNDGVSRKLELMSALYAGLEGAACGLRSNVGECRNPGKPVDQGSAQDRGVSAGESGGVRPKNKFACFPKKRYYLYGRNFYK